MDEIIGNPTQSTDIQQQYPDTCAIKSQQIILNDFGVPVSEDQCVQHAIEQGWYDGNGTSPEDVGKILADAGIPCTQRADANVYDLANELAQGHKVIVGVDSGELWDKGSLWEEIKEWFEDLWDGDMPDHALIVAGIDNSDPDNPMIILTDPGTGESSAEYPLDQFMDAWADSECFMVSTDVATPTAADNFSQNGITDGHLPEIAGVDYNTLTDFQDYSHQIDYTTQGAQLYDMFNTYPTLDNPGFNDALVQFNLPVIDMPPVDPMIMDPSLTGGIPLGTPMNVDPLLFDYSGLSNLDWLNTDIAQESMPTQQDVINSAQQDYIDTLHQTIEDAHIHSQECIDNGSYISATMWDNMAIDAQNQLIDLTNGTDTGII